MTALVRGDVQMAVLPAASVAPLAAEGKLKMLAVTSPQRSPLLPALPDAAARLASPASRPTPGWG